MLVETRKRSIAKALSWRSVAVVVTASVAWSLTGNSSLAIEIGILDTLIKLGAYYAHERAWLRVQFGKPAAPPEYQI